MQSYVLVTYLIAGKFGNAAENVKFLSLKSRMEALGSLILLSKSFEKSVAAFVALLSAAYFPICALLACKTSVILASR